VEILCAYPVDAKRFSVEIKTPVFSRFENGAPNGKKPASDPEELHTFIPEKLKVNEFYFLLCSSFSTFC
jgi:hypothetical protein